MKRAKLLVALVLLTLITLFLVRECNPKQIVFDKEEFKIDTSSVVIPIRIDLSSFEPVFNQSMDEQGWFYEQKNIEVNNQLSLSFRVKKEGEAQLYPANNKIQIRIPLFIDIRPKVNGPLSLGIGRNMQLQSKIILQSSLDIDIDENYDLISSASTSFEIQEAPALTVLGFEFDFEKQLRVSLEEGMQEINVQVEEQVRQAINTKQIVQGIWAVLEDPYEVKNDVMDTWVRFEPIKVYASDLRPSAPGEIETIVKVVSLIDVHTKQVKSRNDKLPKANRVERISDNYSQIHLPLTIELDALMQVVNEAKDEYNIPINKEIELKLSNFSAKNVDDLLEITSDFKSSANIAGKLTIKGNPVFDNATQTLRLANTTVKSKSNNGMVDGLVNSIQRSKTFKTNLEKRLEFSFEKHLEELIFQSTNQINTTEFNEFSRLKGFINQLKVKNIYLQDEYVILVTDIELSTICMVSVESPKAN